MTGGSGKAGANGASRPTVSAGVTSGTAASSASAGTSSGTGLGTSPTASTGTVDSTRIADCSPTGSLATASAGQGQSGPTTLAGVLQEGNLCSTPQGDIPTSSCQAASAEYITCSDPVSGVSSVTFTTYSSLSDLYSSYQQQVTLLSGTFTQNTKAPCGTSANGYAETGWSHRDTYPTTYTTAEMESASFDQLDAMGRQACFVSGGTSYLVWTTDVGQMLAVAQGSSMAALYTWWTQVHQVLLFPGTEMCGAALQRLAAVPQGNLISTPVCPAGGM
jgi:hypothetical protein